MENTQRRLGAIAAQLVQNETSAKSGKRGPNGPQSCPMNFNQVFPRLLEDRPVRVLVTGAAGNIAYSLIFMIANGQMFGPHQKIMLNLLDIPPMAEALKGVEMEIQDGAFPLVQEVLVSTDVKLAFTNIDVAILVGAFPRQKGMERKDLLKKNCAIFQEQGRALDQYASRNVKVVVVGNPANTNCAIAMANAPGLPKENFSALTRLDHNRAKAQVAIKLGTEVTKVHNVVIWGNHSSTQYPDVSLGYVNDYPSHNLKTPVRTAINDDSWIQNTFISTVQLRGAEIIKARKLSSAASAAQAIVGHMRDWLLGTPNGEIVSMAVASDGSYDIPRDVIYSFPVTCSQGQWKIVQGLKIDEFSRKKMQVTLEELQDEKTEAFSFLQK